MSATDEGMIVCCRMAAEVEEVRSEERQGRDAAISAAVAAAREQWQLAQQEAVQVGITS